MGLPPTFELSKEKPDDHASNFHVKDQELKRKRPESGTEAGHILNENQLE
jgi:hypothetical protein